VAIARRLADVPDYQPDWRFRVCTEHLLQIQKSEDKGELARVLNGEGDPFIRQAIKYQSGGPSVIAPSIEYALRTYRSESENRIGSSIRALVVAGRTVEQIAEQFGTKSMHICAYEKLFFDMRRYLNAVAWLKHYCYLTSGESSRLLISAIERGERGLNILLSRQCDSDAPSGKQAIDRFYLAALSRMADHVASLDLRGVPTDDRDIVRLLAAKQLFETSGVPGDLAQLNYPKIFDAQQMKKEKEVHEMVSALSPQSRRKVSAMLSQAKAVVAEMDPAERSKLFSMMK